MTVNHEFGCFGQVLTDCPVDFVAAVSADGIAELRLNYNNDRLTKGIFILVHYVRDDGVMAKTAIGFQWIGNVKSVASNPVNPETMMAEKAAPEKVYRSIVITPTCFNIRLLAIR